MNKSSSAIALDKILGWLQDSLGKHLGGFVASMVLISVISICVLVGAETDAIIETVKKTA